MSTSWSPVITTLTIGLVQAVLFWILFEVLHRKKTLERYFFVRKCNGLAVNPAHDENASRGFLSWIKEDLMISDEALLKCVGLDSYVFLRFLRFGVLLSLSTTLAAFLLIPTYATGDNDDDGTDGFNAITIANVEANASRLWASLLVVFIETFTVCFLLWREWEHLSVHREKWMAGSETEDEASKLSKRSCFVESIPIDQRTTPLLKSYYDNIFPGLVVDANVFLKTPALDKAIAKRQKSLIAWEKADATDNFKPDKAPLLTKADAKLGCLGGKKVPAVPHFTELTAVHDREADRERQGVLSVVSEVEGVENPLVLSGDLTKQFNQTYSTSGSVTFKSAVAREAASQMQVSPDALGMVAMPAPPFTDVIWENVCIDRSNQQYRRYIANTIWMVGMLFWAVPVAAVQAIANLETLESELGLWVPPSDSVLYGLLSGYLPVVAMIVLMAIIPILLTLTAKSLIKVKSMTAVDTYTFVWHFGYQVANLWLVLIGGSIFNQLDAFIDEPSSAINLIAAAVPGAAIFFLNLIITQTLTGLFLELSRLVDVIVGTLLGMLKADAAKPKRDIEAERAPKPIQWGTVIPQFMLSLFVTMVYCYMVPVIAPFALLHFGVALLVFRHNCMYVYHQPNDGGGIMWLTLFNMIMALQYMSQVIFMAYLSIKEGAAQAPIALLALVFTIIFHLRVRNKFQGSYTRVSLETARAVDATTESGESSPADGESKPSGSGGEGGTDEYSSHVYRQPSMDVDSWEREARPYEKPE